MKKTVLRNTLMALALVMGLSLTSCKDKDAEGTMDTDMETTETDVDNTATDELDEEGARDTISITTDTITTVEP